MSYFTRDGPKLTDRIRGKSNDEWIDEIKKEFDKEKMWFDKKKPTFSTFSRDGFPHFDNMRHPEYSGHAWSNGRSGSSNTDWEHAYTIPVNIERDTDNNKQQNSNSSSVGNLENVQQPVQNNMHVRSEENAPGLNQYGLRNTVDIGEHMHKNSKQENELQKRAFSAPPENDSIHAHPVPQTGNGHAPPKRFTSKVEFTPHNPYEPENEQHQAPLVDGNLSSQPQQRPMSPQTNAGQSSNVRHIPIFVEGRREPVAKSPNEKVPNRMQHQPPTQEQSPLKRKLEPASQAPSPHSKDTVDNKSPPAAKILTPLQQIEAVQNEVDLLIKRVEEFNGKDKMDKEYLYLDEMFTRNLIKLDLIEVNGMDDIRTARKNTIKSIQKGISILESKIPSASKSENENSEDVEMAEGEDNQEKEAMETAETKGVENAQDAEARGDQPVSSGNDSKSDHTPSEQMEIVLDSQNKGDEKLDVNEPAANVEKYTQNKNSKPSNRPRSKSKGKDPQLQGTGGKKTNKNK